MPPVVVNLKLKNNIFSSTREKTNMYHRRPITKTYHRASMYKRKGTHSKRITAPVAVGTTMRTSKTRDTNVAAQRELVFTVTSQQSSDSYSVVSFAVNPGLASLFPILSRQAQCYVRYKMRFCLEFVSSVGTAAIGNVVMSINRNRSEPPPSSLAKQMSMGGAVQSNIWSHAEFPTNKAMVRPSEKMLFTRYGSILPGEDINLYDMCNVFIGLTGIDLTAAPVGTALGQVYLTYQCKFYDQRVEDVIDDNAFVLYPYFDENLLTNQPDDVETALPYVLGQGDVQYSGTVDWGASGQPGFALAPKSVTLIFPSAGFYLVQQTMNVSVVGGSVGTPLSEPFGIQPLGATTDSPAQVMNGLTGAGCIVSNSIGQPAWTKDSSAGTVTASITQIVQVLASGTYLVGDNIIVGDAYISKAVGLAGYTGTASYNTNEVQIFNYENIATNAVATILNCYIEVTPCDQTTAAYFFPAVWVSPSPLSGVIGATSIATTAHHRRCQAFQGVPHLHAPRGGAIPKPAASAAASSGVAKLTTNDAFFNDAYQDLAEQIGELKEVRDNLRDIEPEYRKKNWDEKMAEIESDLKAVRKQMQQLVLSHYGPVRGC